MRDSISRLEIEFEKVDDDIACGEDAAPVLHAMSLLSIINEYLKQKRAELNIMRCAMCIRENWFGTEHGERGADLTVYFFGGNNERWTTKGDGRNPSIVRRTINRSTGRRGGAGEGGGEAKLSEIHSSLV